MLQHQIGLSEYMRRLLDRLIEAAAENRRPPQ
jgi:hypothetical protein